MKIYLNKKNILIFIGILILASYQFQIYWIPSSVRDNVLYVEGDFFQRFFIKIFGLLTLFLGLINAFSLRIFLYNFTIKIPLLYYVAKVIILIPIFLSKDYPYTSEHILAINFILFTPLLFINFYGEKGDELFLKLIKIIIWTVCIQLLIDLLIKLFNFHLVTTILGGMGNANTFGLHMIIAALGLRFIYRNQFLSNIILILTWGTGSLMCALISSFLFLQSLIIFFLKRPIIVLSTLTCVVITLIILFIFGFNLLSVIIEFEPVIHVLKKTSELMMGNADNVLVRINFIKETWKLLEENPLSIIFGHPNLLSFWTGDGFFLTFLGTLGLPALLLFVISNFYLFYGGIIKKTPLNQFASYTIIVYMSFFSANRILDYWPSGLIYLLVFNYLSRKDEYLYRKQR